MPRMTSTLTPSRLRLEALKLLQAQPATYNRATLAEKLGERYDRVADAVSDIEAVYGITTEGQSQLITVSPPSIT